MSRRMGVWGVSGCLQCGALVMQEGKLPSSLSRKLGMRKGEYGVEGDMSKMEEPPGTSVFSDIPQTLGTDNSVGWEDSVKAVKAFPREGLRVKTQGKPQGSQEGFLLF